MRTAFAPQRVFRILLAGWCLASAAAAAPGGKLYLDLDGAEGIIEVDVASGDRRLLEVYDYPHVIGAFLPVVEGEQSVLFLAVTATQRRAIHRLDTAAVATSPVSGFADDNLQDPIGGGPNIDGPLMAGLLLASGELCVLRAGRGPMAIDLSTGDRRIVSQSAQPPVGGGYPIENPLDMVELPDGALLVIERFQGLVRIDASTGERSLLATFEGFLETPFRAERLPDGRLLHCQTLGGTNTLFAYDLTRGVDEVVTSSGGYDRGDGEAFGTVFDIAVDTEGRIFALDIQLLAIFSIDAATGDRTIISGGPGNVGSGIELPDAFSSPRLGAATRAPSAIGREWREYGGAAREQPRTKSPPVNFEDLGRWSK